MNLLLDRIETEAKKLDSKEDRTEVEEVVIKAYLSARDKILKHYHKTNWSYCAVLILDPRHKFDSFEKTKWGKEIKDESGKKTFGKIFEEYKRKNDTAKDNNPFSSSAEEAERDEE